ncbi:efflux RND transporter permease subunit [Escherichia coli]|uniref:efflux RND transporter permease subunit n=4 Tax=Escherichia coli TaxID=562 RepID=UPI0023796559|nr:efflux RND transporter permease subunit [Escherichia coli]
MLLLSGCDNTQSNNSSPSETEVGVVTVKSQPVSVVSELTGRTSAALSAEVRPQVGGIIQKRLFKEGDLVKAGQPLYQIDAASYQAAWNEARAALQQAQALVKADCQKAQRYARLVKENGVSQQDADDAQSTCAQDKASVEAKKAALETARINLDWTTVTAPISGRIGISSVTPGALVAIALVLSAIFLPMAFFGGSTGVIYRQFSITIISAMLLSVVVALTLTPALCGSVLQHVPPHKKGFFGAFNRFYRRTEDKYQRGVIYVLRRAARTMGLYVVLGGGMALMMWKLPGSFLPTEDQGEIMVQYTLPAGATAARTAEVNRQIVDWFLINEKANTDVIFTVDGFSFSGSGQNTGMAFVSLKNWSQRKGAENTAQAIALRATKELGTIRDATVFAMTPPAVDGLGQSNGFTFELLANGGTDRETLLQMRNQLIEKANQSPELHSVRANDLPQMPQLQVDIDSNKAVSLGLSLNDVTDTLSSAWGGTYVNDFIDRGRVKKVYIQGDSEFRSAPSDLGKWFVRGSDNAMTPFSAFATTRWLYGPERLVRYNGSAAYEIQGENATGFSSGDAMTKMEELANSLPAGTTWAWSGLSLQEKLASGQALSLYAVSILVVFLCLAALYESWSVPFSVILVIPLGLLGAALAAWMRDLNNDVYFQVALLTTIGLSSKNAILIVEFAEAAVAEGYSLSRAALRAAQTRLRPIIMTSLAFIAGVMPLAIATGAGANSRIAIGTGIIGGTLTATLLAIFFVPLFFVLVKRLFTGKPRRQE